MKTKAHLGLTASIIAMALFLGGAMVHTQGRQMPVSETAPTELSCESKPVILRWGDNKDQKLPEILINNCPVLRIRTAAGGYSPWERGEIVAARLNEALAGGIDPTSIMPGFENGEVVVRSETGLLVTVDQGSVNANQTPALYLASAWANNIRTSLGVEPLEIEQTLKMISRGRSITARASWYGSRFHGRPTASGEIYNQNIYTAAHRTLPFGTLVLVTNPTSGKSVLVRINDRGPFIAGRSIDLSRAAARAIGMEEAGVADVEIAVVGL